MGRALEAIEALNKLIDTSPTDAEAWSELGELYISQGMYQQGIFAVEEVLLITPNAWNVCKMFARVQLSHLFIDFLQIHARLGEIQYMAAFAAQGGNSSEYERLLAEALRRFCRSIELCDDYLRGYYGLKLVRYTHKLITGSLQYLDDWPYDIFAPSFRQTVQER